MIVKQILLASTLRIVWWTVCRICMLMLGCKGLNFTCTFLLLLDFLFYTRRSVSLFSLLFSLHFLWYWQGECHWQTGPSAIGNHCLYSYDPYINICFKGHRYCKEQLEASHSERVKVKTLNTLNCISQNIPLMYFCKFHYLSRLSVWGKTVQRSLPRAVPKAMCKLFSRTDKSRAVNYFFLFC